MVREIKTILIDKVIPYARNPRKNKDAIDYVAASIKEFGFKQPIVVDKDYVIVAGHTRYEASKKLGLEEVPIIIADDLTPQQIKAYRIADNKTSLYSSFDNELLMLEFQELQTDGYNLTNTAFSENEINDILLEKEYGDTDAYQEWEGMPEFNNEDANSFRKLIVHFDKKEDAEDFFKVIGQEYSEKCRSIWYPPKTEVYEGKVNPVFVDE
jgi:hypothetical protein